MTIPDSVSFALIVGAVSAAGACVGGLLSYIATSKATRNALRGIDKEIKFRHATKIAEFRQEWINDLRESMALLQSLGVTPDLQQQWESEFYRAGTKIELLMNRNDQHYERLRDSMYAFLAAKTEEEKYLCNAPFILVCQDILKTEWEVLKKDLDAARV